MNPITLPTSPETRAALEQAGWQVQPINAGYVVLTKGKSTVGLWADGNHTISATAPEWNEVAALLGLHPEGHRIVATKTLLRAHQICDMHVNLAQVVAKVDVSCLVKDTKTALAVALGVAPPQPRPSVDGGLSPSPPGELSDEDLRAWSEITASEPGFHQVNPINQRRAPVLSDDPFVLLEVLYNSAVNDSRLDPDVERQIRRVLGLDRVAEPREEDGDPSPLAALELLEALEELVDLMEAVRSGEYRPDSFTTQPARAAIAKAKGEPVPELEAGAPAAQEE